MEDFALACITSSIWTTNWRSLATGYSSRLKKQGRHHLLIINYFSSGEFYAYFKSHFIPQIHKNEDSPNTTKTTIHLPVVKW
jgi:hypothetical protein